MRKSQSSKLVWGVLIVCGVLLFDNPIRSALFRFLGVISPFIWGFVLAYLLERPCFLLEQLYIKHKLLSKRARVLAVLSLYTVLIIVLIFVVAFAVPVLIRNVVAFSSRLPILYEQWRSTLYNHQYPEWLAGFLSRESIDRILEALSIQGVMAALSNYVVTIMGGLVSISASIINGFITVIFSIYSLIYKDALLRFVDRCMRVFIDGKRLDHIESVLKHSNLIFKRFIFAQSLDAIILGVLATVLLSILGVDYAVLFGVFLGFCNMIPYFGSLFGSIITTVVTFFTGGYQLAIITGLSLLALQQVDGNFIGPRIMGDSLDINPMIIIFAITVGGAYFGVVGMFLSVPVSAILKLLVDDMLGGTQEGYD